MYVKIYISFTLHLLHPGSHDPCNNCMHVKIYVSFTLHLLHLHPGSLVPGIRVCPEMLCVFRYKLIDVLTYIVK